MDILQKLRQDIRLKRRQLPPDIQKHCAESVAQKALCFSAVQHGHGFGLYLANDGELDPAPLLTELVKRQKNCFVPVLSTDNPKTFEFYAYKPGDELIKNIYNIPEPLTTHKTSMNPRDLDIIFVPLVAFDLQGTRVGMGVGYYDRTLAFLKNNPTQKPLLIGLAYELQKVKTLEPREWDIPLQAVITEQELYAFL